MNVFSLSLNQDWINVHSIDCISLINLVWQEWNVLIGICMSRCMMSPDNQLPRRICHLIYMHWMCMFSDCVWVFLLLCAYFMLGWCAISGDNDAVQRCTSTSTRNFMLLNQNVLLHNQGVHYIDLNALHLFEYEVSNDFFGDNFMEARA